MVSWKHLPLIQLSPPRYFTDQAWFFIQITSLGLLAVLTATLIVRWMTARSRRNVALLEQLVRERTWELEQSNEQYRWLVEGLQENYVFFKIHQDGTVQYASPSIERVLGYPVDAVVGTNWNRLLADGALKHSSFEKFVNQTFKRRSAVTIELSMRHADGSIRQLEVTPASARTNGKEIETRECIARDVTELKRTQAALRHTRDELERRVETRTTELWEANEELRNEIEEREQIRQRLHESELRYRSIVEDQREMIIRFTKEGLITFANGAYCRENDISAEELKTWNCFELIHPDDQLRAMKKIERLTIDSDYVTDLMRIRRKDGTEYWADWSARALYDDNRRLLGYQAVGRVVTDLVQTQQRLRESEQRYRNIVEEQQEMVVRCDLEGNISFCNGAYARAIGLNAEQIVGQSCFQFIHPDDAELAQEQIAAMAAGEMQAASQTRMLQHDGEIRWCAWTGHSLLDVNHAPIGFQGVGRDITELRLAQMKLTEKENQLNHLARVSALGEMVAGISHEIKQPLATISNFASAAALVLKGPEQGPEERERLRSWVERISIQIERINAIIRRLRRFSRPNSQRSLIQILDVIDESLLVMENSTRNLVETVTVDSSNDLPLIHADRVQIEQVLVNLIRNACDAMQDSPAPHYLRITAQHIETSVEVTVEDSGPGIPSDIARQVFESFVTTKSEGVGIGLAISRSIIEAHGGRIFAIPDTSGGRVVFSLPVESVTTDNG
jgi:two-component system sensor kinase FixL